MAGRKKMMKALAFWIDPTTAGRVQQVGVIRGAVNRVSPERRVGALCALCELRDGRTVPLPILGLHQELNTISDAIFGIEPSILIVPRHLRFSANTKMNEAWDVATRNLRERNLPWKNTLNTSMASAWTSLFATPSSGLPYALMLEPYLLEEKLAEAVGLFWDMGEEDRLSWAWVPSEVRKLRDPAVWRAADMADWTEGQRLSELRLTAEQEGNTQA